MIRGLIKFFFDNSHMRNIHEYIIYNMYIYVYIYMYIYVYIVYMYICILIQIQIYLDELNFLVAERIFASSHLLLHQSDFLHLPGSYQFYHLKIFWRNLSGPIPRPYSSALCSLKGGKVQKYRDYYFQGSNFQKTFHVNF